MTAVARFEDLIVWQKARQLAREVHSACATGRAARDYALTDQMRRASVSIVSNIAEGFERKHATYFRQFLSYARGSCAELRAQLYLASDVGWLSQSEFLRLSENAIEVGRLLGALFRSQTPFAKHATEHTS
jgi:four helix bundle protein